MNENELLQKLVNYYQGAGIPEAKIPSHMDTMICRVLQEIYKDREGYFVLPSGDRIERFDVGRLRASLELAADNGQLQLTSSDVTQLERLTMEKIEALGLKVIPSKRIRFFVSEALLELGFRQLAEAYRQTRPLHYRPDSPFRFLP